MAEKSRTERRGTARRHTDEELALASFAVDHAAMAVFMLDEQARIVRVNREACRALGYTADELLSLTLHDITAGFDMELWPDHWSALQREGTVVLAQIRSGTTSAECTASGWSDYFGANEDGQILLDVDAWRLNTPAATYGRYIQVKLTLKRE